MRTNKIKGSVHRRPSKLFDLNLYRKSRTNRLCVCRNTACTQETQVVIATIHTRASTPLYSSSLLLFVCCKSLQLRLSFCDVRVHRLSTQGRSATPWIIRVRINRTNRGLLRGCCLLNTETILLIILECHYNTPWSPGLFLPKSVLRLQTKQQIKKYDTGYSSLNKNSALV